MKIKILYLVLLITSLKSTNLICASQKSKTKDPKSLVDQIATSKSRRDLARENLDLKRRLSQAESEPDLEMGLGVGAPAGAGTGLVAHTPTATSPQPMRSKDLMVGLFGTQTTIAREQFKFHREVYKRLEEHRKRLIYASLLSGAASVVVSTVISNHKTILGWFGL